jgi:agmatine deiminase
LPYDAMQFPADWQSHSCCYLAWAVHHEWGQYVNEVKKELRNVIATIAAFEPVRLLTPAGSVDEAKQQVFGLSVDVIEAPVDDVWMRDIAPTFGRRGNELIAVDWNFNSWGSTSQRRPRSGDRLATKAAMIFKATRIQMPFTAEGGAFITDGKGTVIVTKSCLLNNNRNGSVTTEQIESYLSVLGVKKVIWLNGDPHEPITSGHVDGYVMFGESGDVLVEDVSGIGKAADQRRRQDIEILRSSTDASGNQLKIIVVAPPREDFWAYRDSLFAPSYLNAYVANGAIIAGKFGDPERDKLAQLALHSAFPSRDFRMLEINHIAAGGGGVRCLTQPVPA